MIQSPYDLSELLIRITKSRITLKKLIYIQYHKEQFYRKFRINKKSGGEREIVAPNSELKMIQRVILDYVLYEPLRHHPSCQGFVSKRSVFTNAAYHTAKRALWKLDIKDFFPTITTERVRATLGTLGFQNELSELLAELLTFEGKLPQGAPTSPYMANLVCLKLDTRLNRYAKGYDLKYTRYADDLTFSGSKITGATMKRIKEIVNDEGFQLNEVKSRFMSKGTRQIVCGLVVNEAVGFGREKYLKIRATIHNCKKYGPHSQHKGNAPYFKEHLIGRIAFLKKLSPDKWIKLKNQIESLDWKNEQIKEETISVLLKINKVSQTHMLIYSKNDLKAFSAPCTSHDEFVARTLELFHFIDYMDISYFINRDNALEKILENFGKLNLLEEYLTLHYAKEAEAIIPNLRSIKALADNLKRHEDESRTRWVFKRYHIDPSDPNYENFRYCLLMGFKDSLKKLLDILQVENL